LTPHHFDHIHGVDYFKNARIMAGKEELWAFTDKDRYMESLGYHRWEELMGSPKDDNWAKISLPADVLRGPGFQSIPVTAVFEDGDEIGLGHTSLTTVHVPGLSPGHYAFFFPRKKSCFPPIWIFLPPVPGMETYGLILTTWSNPYIN
jgi:glyoxylase-like metal-dependent hydrolase (beta-lactamase superfamily II)